MTLAQVKQQGAAVPRAGTQALSLLAIPINAAVVRALAGEPKSLIDLRREVDSPPQTTMRAYLRTLVRTGVVERNRSNDFPGNVEYRLGDGGNELLAVAEVVSVWLATCPEAPTAFGSGAARSAIKALVGGWSTSMVRALAVRPLSLTELDSIIASVSYPSLERRLGAMRHECLVEPLASQGRGTPYAASDWLRKATAPLAAAALWEMRNLGEKSPAPTKADVEAAFLLALPLVRLPRDVSGSCRLAVQIDERRALAGVVFSIKAGKVDGCETRLERSADGWAVGTTAAWFATLVEREPDCLEMGGDTKLAEQVLGSLRQTVFGPGRVSY